MLVEVVMIMGDSSDHSLFCFFKYFHLRNCLPVEQRYTASYKKNSLSPTKII